jgi:GNAT superfamily N-acetyltransferase
MYFYQDFFDPMKPSVHIRVLLPDEHARYRDTRLRALLESPAAFCSTHAEESQRTAQDWESRLARAAASGGDLPMVALVGEDVVGMAWAKADADDASNVNLYQMWVAPEARGAGVARALLDHAIQWSRARGACSLSLGVTSKESAAFRLYTKAGFTLIASSASSHDMRLMLE